MTNQIFAALENQAIDSFVAEFTAVSREIFFDETARQLRHPGEFGAFRERLCARFLSLFIPSYLGVGSGFLIDSNDQVSSQSDLVVYDSQYTPMMTDSQNFRFFPIETVVCIGEVKSTLEKKEFFDALTKLARNKELCNVSGKSIARRSAGIDAEDIGHHFDTAASFLICERLRFSVKDLTAQITAHYERENVPVEFRHNLVLSIDDGILCYSNHLVQRNIAWMYPVSNDERMKNRLVTPGHNGRNHFRIFTAYMFMICANTTVYLPNIGDYGTAPSIGDYQDES